MLAERHRGGEVDERVSVYAAGLGLGGNESYPGVFQPFGGFADDVPVENAYVGLPNIPDVGFEGKAILIRLMRQVAE